MRKWDATGKSSADIEDPPKADKALAKLPSAAVQDDQTRLLQARTTKVDFRTVVGKTQLVTAGVGRSAQAGFFCSVCNVVLKDSVSYIDHVNGRTQMRVKKSSVGDVKSRLAALKRKKEQVEVEYDFDARVAVAKEKEDEQKRLKREARKKAKIKKRQKTENIPSSSQKQGSHIDENGKEVNEEEEEEEEVIDSDEEWARQMEEEKEMLLQSTHKDKKASPEPDIEVVTTEDSDMMKMMGFGLFGSTKS